jgi:hypothetical protein
MYEFLFESCILRCLNYVQVFIWILYFKILELYMKKISLLFNDMFLRPEFILYFSCRIKNTYKGTELSILCFDYSFYFDFFLILGSN